MSKKNIFFLMALEIVFFLCVCPLQIASAHSRESDGSFRFSPQQRMEEAYQRLANMTPEQKEQYRARMENWEDLDPQQKKRIRKRFEQYQELPS